MELKPHALMVLDLSRSALGEGGDELPEVIPGLPIQKALLRDCFPGLWLKHPISAPNQRERIPPQIARIDEAGEQGIDDDQNLPLATGAERFLERSAAERTTRCTASAPVDHRLRIRRSYYIRTIHDYRNNREFPPTKYIRP